MKRFSWIGLIIIAGCQVNVGQPIVDASPKNDAKPPVEASKTSPSDGIAKSVPDEQKPGFNKNRIHQLSDLKKTTVEINGHKLNTWVMDNDSLREEGMMFLTDKEVKP